MLRADFHRPHGPRGGGDKAEADTEAEHVIRRRLAEAFPWRYLGEETGRGDGETGSPVWLVDPNDGTRDYLVGRRGSAVSIGLVDGGRPVLGVVFAFAYPDGEGDLFTWAEGCGPLRRNGGETAAVLPAPLGRTDVVLVSSKGDRDPETNLRCADPARYRTLPSIAHRLALVAAGEAAATSSLWSPRDWDYGAGHALLRGNGGTLVDEDGREVRYAEDGTSHCATAFGGSEPVARLLAGRPWGSALYGPWGAVRPARVPPGKAIADSGLLRRAQGCLLGQVAGDSLGSLVEFARASEIGARYGDGPRVLEDGGVHDTLAGQPTDDSEMALALARSIVARDGFEAAAALEAYQQWMASFPFDIGHTTHAALSGQPRHDSQANGSLMRSEPAGGVRARAAARARGRAGARRQRAHASESRVRRRRRRLRGGGRACGDARRCAGRVRGRARVGGRARGEAGRRCAEGGGRRAPACEGPHRAGC